MTNLLHNCGEIRDCYSIVYLLSHSDFFRFVHSTEKWNNTNCSDNNLWQMLNEFNDNINNISLRVFQLIFSLHAAYAERLAKLSKFIFFSSN